MKRAWLFVVLGLGACDPGAGGSEVSEGPPPARFRGDTTASSVVFTSDVEKKCKAAGLKEIAGTKTNACSMVGGSVRAIIVSNPCKASGKYAEDLCHELGHLNGWSGKHER